jgi:hypothetical protein
VSVLMSERVAQPGVGRGGLGRSLNAFHAPANWS